MIPSPHRTWGRAQYLGLVALHPHLLCGGSDCTHSACTHPPSGEPLSLCTPHSHTVSVYPPPTHCLCIWLNGVCTNSPLLPSSPQAVVITFKRNSFRHRRLKEAAVHFDVSFSKYYCISNATSVPPYSLRWTLCTSSKARTSLAWSSRCPQWRSMGLEERTMLS